VSDDVDEVKLEPGGDWHTSDNKYGSATWLATHLNDASNNIPSNGIPTPTETKPSVEPEKSASPDTKGKRKAIEILSDSDEEEAPLSRQNGTHHLSLPSWSLATNPNSRNPPAPSTTRPASINPPVTQHTSVQPAQDAVIDLTLDDSDDEPNDDARGDGMDAYFRPPGAGFSGRDAYASTRLIVPELLPPLHWGDDYQSSVARPAFGVSLSDDMQHRIMASYPPSSPLYPPLAQNRWAYDYGGPASAPIIPASSSDIAAWGAWRQDGERPHWKDGLHDVYPARSHSFGESSRVPKRSKASDWMEDEYSNYR